ncbi:MAG: hypothetical protein ACTH6A_09815 [Brachybacterium tyrofermentans]|uniref:hypothetical protein n=1 Tax=Brachybacterium tyrofermentans TaxID=47848 RepID=UPI003F8E3D03
MDTARITAELFNETGIHAVTFVDSYADLPLIHITQTRSDRNELFGLDTLTITGYASGRSGVLDVVENALALADGRPVFSAKYGLIDRLERLSAPVPMTFVDDLMTASAEVTAEYRL